MEKKYAPPDDPVFDLVPRAFAVCANAIWVDMGSPEPKFENAWEIYLHICDALRSMAWDGVFQQSLSAASQPENYSEELPRDLALDEDESLLVDVSEDEESIPIVDLTDNEEANEDLGTIELSSTFS
jgi:hypothetical protein